MYDPSVAYYTAAVVGAFVLAYKVFWAKPAKGLRAGVYAMIGTMVCIELFAAPPTIGLVNRITGVDNFSAPLVYVMVVLIGAFQQILLVMWRYELASNERARKIVRRWWLFYGSAMVALVVLFIAGADRVPVERRTDFDTFYANTPIINIFIVLYLLVFAVSPLSVIWMTLRWSRIKGMTTWLRRGLVCLAISQTFAASFVVVKLTAVVAAANGTNLDYLSSEVAPGLASLATLLYALGWSIPRLQIFQDYRDLAPLWQALTDAEPSVRRHRSDMSRLRIKLHVAQRLVEIRDAQLRMREHFDPAVTQSAQHAAEQAGWQGIRQAAAVEAMRLTAALKAKTAGRRFTSHACDEVVSKGDGAAAEFDFLVEVSRLFPLEPDTVPPQRTTSGAERVAP